MKLQLLFASTGLGLSAIFGGLAVYLLQMSQTSTTIDNLVTML